MGEPRAGYAVTLLADDRVLVCGGKANGGGTRFASCEIWNMDTEAWRPAGGLTRPREQAAAVQLGDGRALFVGGVGSTKDASYAVDVWDPRRNDSAAAGVLPFPAENPLAAPMPDGRVIVVDDGPKFERTRVAIWNPATDKASTTDAPNDVGRTIGLFVDTTGMTTLVRSRAGCHEVAIWRRPDAGVWALAHLEEVPVCAVGAVALDEEQFVYWSERFGLGAPYATRWRVSAGESQRLDLPEPARFEKLIALGIGRLMVVGRSESYLRGSEDAWRPSGAVDASAESKFIALADGRVLMVGPTDVRIWTPAEFSNGRPCAGAAAFFDAAAARDLERISVERPTRDNVGPECRGVVGTDPSADASGALKRLALRPERAKARLGMQALCALRAGWAADIMIRGLAPGATDDQGVACLAALAESDQPEARAAVDHYLQARAEGGLSIEPLVVAARSSERLRARMGPVLAAYWRDRRHGFDQLRQVACTPLVPAGSLDICTRTLEQQEREWLLEGQERRAKQWQRAGLYLEMGGAVALGAGMAVAGVATSNDDFGRAIAIAAGGLGGGAAFMAPYIGVHDTANAFTVADFQRRVMAVIGGVVGATVAALVTATPGWPRGATSIVGGAVFSAVSVTALWHFRDF